MKWLILLSTDVGDVVVDPFVGSGTTAVAARMVKRSYIVGDIEPEFYDQTKKRLS